MPAKPAAAKAAPAAATAAAAAAAAEPPPPPPDLGPNISPHLPRIREVFALFDAEGTGFMATSQVLTLLHALGVCATQEEFEAAILPRLESAGAPTPRVAYGRLEAAALALLGARAYPAPGALELAAAFRALDKEGAGSCTIESLRRALTNPATPSAMSLAEFDALIAKMPRVAVAEGERERVAYEAYARAL
jgi:Ca2+-binding EF-hand superfamily protein